MFVALVIVALVLLGTAAGAGAVAAAARRDLHALAAAHAKLEGRVAALAPAQVDALDAAISARLDALAAPAPAPAPVACTAREVPHASERRESGRAA